jgi:hypothetical protein
VRRAAPAAPSTKTRATATFRLVPNPCCARRSRGSASLASSALGAAREHDPMAALFELRLASSADAGRSSRGLDCHQFQKWDQGSAAERGPHQARSARRRAPVSSKGPRAGAQKNAPSPAWHDQAQVGTAPSSRIRLERSGEHEALGTFVRRVRCDDVADPAEQPSAAQPQARSDDQPENSPQEIAIIDLPNTRQDEGENGSKPRSVRHPYNISPGSGRARVRAPALRKTRRAPPGARSP